MLGNKILWTIAAFTLVIFAAGCSGSSGLSVPSNQPAVSTDEAAMFNGLPGIPIDGAEPFKVSSDDSGDPFFPPEPPPGPAEHMVFGFDFLVMDGGFTAGTSLVLGLGGDGNQPAGGPPNGIKNLCYALYRINGLVGQRPVSFNSETIPMERDAAYFVGLANYSDMHWDWFGPVNFPEFQLDLANNDSNYVTHLGNLYFMIVCMQGNVIRHDRSVVVTGPGGDPSRPGAPFDLNASDGMFPFEILVEWMPGEGADVYEVWRLGPIFGAGGDPSDPPGDPGGDPNDPPIADWILVGITPEPFFFDPGLPPHENYIYRARSVNGAGVSTWSNEDLGWAANGDPPPPGGCVVEGVVMTGETGAGYVEPLPGIQMYLSNYPFEIMVITDEAGYFRFENVSPGLHMVAPVATTYEFEPPYHAVFLDVPPDGGMCSAFVEFYATPADVANRVWGFVHQDGDNTPGAPGGWLPIPGVEVWATHQGELDVAFGATTNGDGYYAFNIGSDGPYKVEASMPGYGFDPPMYNIFIGGDLAEFPRPMNFFGFPGVYPPD